MLRLRRPAFARRRSLLLLLLTVMNRPCPCSVLTLVRMCDGVVVRMRCGTTDAASQVHVVLHLMRAGLLLVLGIAVEVMLVVIRHAGVSRTIVVMVAGSRAGRTLVHAISQQLLVDSLAAGKS